MAKISFTSNLRRHIDCPSLTVEADTLRKALNVVFQDNPRLQGYILDDQGHLRKHIFIAIDGDLVSNDSDLNILLRADANIYVVQALSGG